jgi:Fic family protein
MSYFTPSRITIDSEILSLMEAISRKQGELDRVQRNTREDSRFESMAAVDAVHFSTKIEGNTLSRDQVTQALQTKKPRASVRDLNEVLNYARVRQMVREQVLKSKSLFLNDDWVLKHHAELLKGIVKGRLRGHYREAQCVIQDSKTHAIVYMAPEWRDVPVLMKELLSWLKRQRLNGGSHLLLAAQFHFEFVTIHPFMDGNGRLARLLTNGILLAGGYDVGQYAALEKQHESDRAHYYRALRSLQSNNFYDIPASQDIRSWVEYWLRCLLATYEEALARVGGGSTGSSPQSSFPFDERLSKAETLFRRHRRLSASQYADLMSLGRTQAVADLNALVSAGILERLGGGRSTIYKLK